MGFGYLFDINLFNFYKHIIFYSKCTELTEPVKLTSCFPIVSEVLLKYSKLFCIPQLTRD